MNYQRIYDKIIEKRRLYPLNRKDGYCEYHHIIPKCIGGDYCPRSKKWNKRGTNLVGLTAREHFIVHRILERIYPNNCALAKTVLFMSSHSTDFSRRITSREYERLKLKSAKFSSQNAKKHRNILREISKCRAKLYLFKGRMLNLNDISKITGVSHSTLYSRIKKGMSLEDALGKTKYRVFMINGQTLTLKEIQEKYRIKISTFLSRIGRGMSVFDAINIPRGTKITKTDRFKRLKVFDQKLTYDEIRKIYGISKSTLSQKLRKGEKIEHILKNIRNTNTQYTYDGQTHTLREWERIRGWKRGFINHRIEIGWDLEKIMKTEKIEAKRYEYLGKFYTINEISKTFGLNKSTIRSRIRNGMSIKDVIESKVKDRNQRIYTYNGETLTLKQISEKYNIKLGTLYTRICRMKMSIEDAIKTKIGRW